MNWLMNGSALSGWRAGGGMFLLIMRAGFVIRTVFFGLFRRFVGWSLERRLTSSSHKTYYLLILSEERAVVNRSQPSLNHSTPPWGLLLPKSRCTLGRHSSEGAQPCRW